MLLACSGVVPWSCGSMHERVHAYVLWVLSAVVGPSVTAFQRSLTIV